MSQPQRFLFACMLGCASLLILAGPAVAQRRVFAPRIYRPAVVPSNRMPGWDWRRIYPWSPYNYGRNPYNPIIYPYSPYYAYVPQPTPFEDQPLPTYTTPLTTTQSMVPEPTGPIQVPPADAALIRLYVPDPYAEIWFNDARTYSTGSTRYYVSPDLASSKPYYYEVTARWTHDGQAVTEDRRVSVSPGATAVVDFRKPQSTSP
jgi:uncharacterized protein (TIGR03000 family)